VWSVIDICYKNDEQAAIEAQNAGRPIPAEVLHKLDEIAPPSEPLETLVFRLKKASPMSISHLIHIFTPMDGAMEFSDLIKTYLPDRTKEIMAFDAPCEQMSRFAEIFSDIYFPIETDDDYYDRGDDEEGDSYSWLTGQCPVIFQFITSDQYDEWAQDTNYPTELIVALILENPYASNDKAAFADTAAKLIPVRFIELLPEDGFEIEHLEEWLKDTQFEPIAYWSKVIAHNTGNDFFDNSFNMEETGAQINVSWNIGTIYNLRKQWQEAEAFMGRWADFKNWFEKDLVKNTRNLIKILRERSGYGKEENDNNTNWPNPELNPNQGRLIDILSDETPVGSPANSTDTAGPTQSTFGLL
jgi:hypothetical protein